MRWTIENLRAAARGLGYEIRRTNVYTRPDQRLQAQLAHHRVDVVLDVGAHDGTYGHSLLKGGFNGTVISFEAQPSVYEKLVRKSAPFGDRWIVAPRSAIGDAAETVRFYVTAASASSSTMLPQNAAGSLSDLLEVKEVIDVGSCRLDAIDLLLRFRGKRLFAKIDVQGAEDKVIRGASGIMDDICGMTVEMSQTSYYSGAVLASELDAGLTKIGFQLWDIEPVLRDSGTGRLEQYDATYFRSIK